MNENGEPRRRSPCGVAFEPEVQNSAAWRRGLSSLCIIVRCLLGLPVYPVLPWDCRPGIPSLVLRVRPTLSLCLPAVPVLPWDCRPGIPSLVLRVRPTLSLCLPELPVYRSPGTAMRRLERNRIPYSQCTTRHSYW